MKYGCIQASMMALGNKPETNLEPTTFNLGSGTTLEHTWHNVPT